MMVESTILHQGSVEGLSMSAVQILITKEGIIAPTTIYHGLGTKTNLLLLLVLTFRKQPSSPSWSPSEVLLLSSRSFCRMNARRKETYSHRKEARQGHTNSRADLVGNRVCVYPTSATPPSTRLRRSTSQTAQLRGNLRGRNLR